MKKVIFFICLLSIVGCSNHDSLDTVQPAIQVIEVAQITYTLNPNSMKIHRDNCISAQNMLDQNKVFSSENYDILVTGGYIPCKICNPV